jgi:hypothetical protein
VLRNTSEPAFDEPENVIEACRVLELLNVAALEIVGAEPVLQLPPVAQEPDDVLVQLSTACARAATDESPSAAAASNPAVIPPPIRSPLAPKRHPLPCASPGRARPRRAGGGETVRLPRTSPEWCTALVPVERGANGDRPARMRPPRTEEQFARSGALNTRLAPSRPIPWRTACRTSRLSRSPEQLIARSSRRRSPLMRSATRAQARPIAPATMAIGFGQRPAFVSSGLRFKVTLSLVLFDPVFE